MNTLSNLKSVWLFLVLFCFFAPNINAQTPQAISYQAVARNAEGVLLTNQDVGIRISVLKSSIDGSPVYIEKHTVTTNGFGLINLQIGRGEAVSGAFGNIAWATDRFFVKVEIDTNGGNSFVEVGASELLSVPYAFHAKTAEILTGTVKISTSGVCNENTEGTLRYKTDDKTMQYCNGKQWITFSTDATIPESTIDHGTSVTDIEDNTYQTVVIGTQTWMAENLKTTTLNDGTDIQNITDNEEWLSTEDAAYCWYNNDEARYKDQYGGIYNGYAVRTGKLCPSGWHVPTKEDWEILVSFLGGDNIAGKKLKSTSGWYDDHNGTDIYGFNALPGVIRPDIIPGDFKGGDGKGVTWWTSTKPTIGPQFNWISNISHNHDIVAYTYYAITSGYPVRCIKDQK